MSFSSVYSKLRTDRVLFSVMYILVACSMFLIGIILGEMQSGEIERIYKLGGILVTSTILVGGTVVLHRSWYTSKRLCVFLVMLMVATAARHFYIFPEIVALVLNDMAIVYMVLALFTRTCAYGRRDYAQKAQRKGR